MTNPDPTPTAGERLAALRSAAGLSQSQLAERTGLHRNTISNLETGGNEYFMCCRLSTLTAYLEGVGYRLDIEFATMSGDE